MLIVICTDSDSIPGIYKLYSAPIGPPIDDPPFYNTNKPNNNENIQSDSIQIVNLRGRIILPKPNTGAFHEKGSSFIGYQDPLIRLSGYTDVC